jgi:hypothetical protein
MPQVPLPPADGLTGAVRVVFFGPPRSGKSVLLDAVARYAGAGAEDPPLTLSAADPNAVRRELVPLRLLVDRPGPRAETGAVLFLDCDGQAAQDLLTHADRLKQRTARTALADAIRQADALVLVIDAGWSEAEVEAAFRSFDRFMEVLESTRADDREVGGFPVFLTLTKCDALRRPADEPTDWLARVDARKRNLRERFADWFEPDDSEDGPFLSFGSTDVRTHATAAVVPADPGFAPYTDAAGGFGVAELFDAAFAAARDHQRRAVRSQTRLTWTAGLAVGLLGVVLAVMFGLTASRPPGPVELLTGRVVRLQQIEGPTAVRLSEANLERNRRAVAGVRESPAFDGLPPGLQAFVEDRHREYAAYTEYRARFQPPQFGPADVRTRSDFDRLTAELVGPLAPPPEFERQWADTEMVRLRAKWREDLKLLEAAEAQVHAWFQGQIARASGLMRAAVPVEVSPSQWRADITDTLAQTPPFDPAAPVPGSESLPFGRGAALTFDTAFRFERSANARRDWEQMTARLADLRDLADAVGLTTNPNDPASPPLDLPAPNGGDSRGLAAARLEALKQRFPKAYDGTANWSVADLPAPLRDVLGQRLRLAAGTGVAHVHRMILGELSLNGRADTPADWAKLTTREPAGLLTKPELQDWGRLLRLLFRWSDPARPDADPVAELSAFLRKERFDWPLTRLDVTLPDALRVMLLRPAGDLTITVTSGGQPRTFRFEPAASAERTGGAAVYRFLPRDSAQLSFTPGDGFAAELPLTDGETRYVLRWEDARTGAYQFEKLSREPTITAAGPGAVPQRATGVRVKPTPEASGFGVPELLPETR